MLSLLLLTGCAPTTEYNFYTHPPAANNLVAAPIATAYYPYQVRVYDYSHRPNQPYIPIGEVTVTKVNNYGLMRQQARVNTLFREEATIMGGDAVVILPSNDDKWHAEVIEFQQPDQGSRNLDDQENTENSK